MCAQWVSTIVGPLWEGLVPYQLAGFLIIMMIMIMIMMVMIMLLVMMMLVIMITTYHDYDYDHHHHDICIKFQVGQKFQKNMIMTAHILTTPYLLDMMMLLVTYIWLTNWSGTTPTLTTSTSAPQLRRPGNVTRYICHASSQSRSRLSSLTNATRYTVATGCCSQQSPSPSRSVHD